MQLRKSHQIQMHIQLFQATSAGGKDKVLFPDVIWYIHMESKYRTLHSIATLDCDKSQDKTRLPGQLVDMRRISFEQLHSARFGMRARPPNISW